MPTRTSASGEGGELAELGAGVRVALVPDVGGAAGVEVGVAQAAAKTKTAGPSCKRVFTGRMVAANPRKRKLDGWPSPLRSEQPKLL